MELKRVGDIMIPLDRYPHIPYWFTLRQAVVEMEKAQFDIAGRKSLPRYVLVFDEEYRLLGTARRRDIMRGLEPHFLLSKSVEAMSGLFDQKVDPNLFEMSYDKLAERIRKRADRPISEVMRPIKLTIQFDDHLLKAVSEFVESDVSIIPVLKDGKVVGVVRTVGVFRELAKLIL